MKRLKQKQADNLAYSAEKSLKDMAEKIDATQKQKIEAAIKDLRESIKSKMKGRAAKDGCPYKYAA